MLAIDPAMAVEEAKYEVVRTDGGIELRDYAPSIVAETVVEGDFEDAGNKAFRALFRYIDGENRTQSKIAMTAPVAQQPESRKIAMTAPVSQQAADGGWVVSFMMPASFTSETTPEPLNPAVKIRQVPAYRAAAIRYSGFWSEKNYREHLEELQAWIGRIIVFGVVLAVGGLLGWGISKIIRLSALSGVDRFMGSLFGAARGTLLVAVALIGAQFAGFDNDDWWLQSRLIPHLEVVADWIKVMAPEGLDMIVPDGEADSLPGETPIEV